MTQRPDSEWDGSWIPWEPGVGGRLSICSREFRDCEFRLSNPAIRVLHWLQFPQQQRVRGQRGEPTPPVRIPIVKAQNKQLKWPGRGRWRRLEAHCGVVSEMALIVCRSSKLAINPSQAAAGVAAPGHRHLPQPRNQATSRLAARGPAHGRGGEHPPRQTALSSG